LLGLGLLVDEKVTGSSYSSEETPPVPSKGQEKKLFTSGNLLDCGRGGDGGGVGWEGGAGGFSG